jgi:hypothetical protein
MRIVKRMVFFRMISITSDAIGNEISFNLSPFSPSMTQTDVRSFLHYNDKNIPFFFVIILNRKKSTLLKKN